MDSTTTTTIGMWKRKRNLEIPSDVTIEILLRLPARSIVRFRLACQLWRSETLDPYFINAHLDLARKVCPPSILLFKIGLNEFTILGKSRSSLRFYLRPNYQDVLYHGSRNGIVCFAGYHEKIIHLFNPATSDDLRVPKDPNYNDRVYFGFHPVTKEYSVVNVYQKNEGIDEMSLGTKPLSGCRVYTIGTTHRSWREINTIINDFYPVHGFAATELNGTMYFVSNGYTFSVVSFDLQNETFTQIPLPGFGYHYPNIFELRGSVCVMNRFAGHFDIWRLDEYDNKREWTLMYSILERKDMIPDKPLCIHGDKILMTAYFFDRKVLCYLRVKHNFEYDGAGARNSYGMYSAYAHVESLVALPNQ